MLLLGVCNPPGETHSYNGLYFKQTELEGMVQERALLGMPVKAEHTGANVGSVRSAFINNDGALSCVIDIPEKCLQSTILANLVRDKVALDLSMGYSVDVQHSSSDEPLSQKRLLAGKKRTLEISVVRKGARDGCHILAYEDANGICKWRPRASKHSKPSMPQCVEQPGSHHQPRYTDDFKTFFTSVLK